MASMNTYHELIIASKCVNNEHVCSLFMRIVLGEDIIPDLQMYVSTTEGALCLNDEIGFLVPGPYYDEELQCVCDLRFETIHGVPTDQDSLCARKEFVECYTSALQQGFCKCCEEYRCGERRAHLELVHAAAWVGDIKLLAFLGDHGCSLDAASGLNNVHPLHLAVTGHQKDTVQYLLSAVRDIEIDAECLCATFSIDYHQTLVNNIQPETCSPLMLAISLSKTMETNGKSDRLVYDEPRGMYCIAPLDTSEIVDILLGAGAACSESHCERALHRHTTAVFNTVLEYRTATKWDKETLGRLLRVAITHGLYVGKMALLLKLGAPVRSDVDMEICLPLVLRDHHDVLKMLFENGLQFDLGADVQGYTLLDYAIAMDWKDSIKVLQEVGYHCHANVSENISPYYALILYMMNDNEDAEELCLESMDRLHAVGHDVNKLIPDLDGICRTYSQNERTSCTVLHYIADNYNTVEVSVLRKLLELGADPDIPDGKGRTPLAAVFGNGALAQIGISDSTERISALIDYNASMDLNLEVELFHHSLKRLCIEYRHTTVTPLLLSVLVQSRGLASYCPTFFQIKTPVDILFEAGYDVYREDLSRYPTDDSSKSLVDIVVKRKCELDLLTNLCRNSLRRQYGGHRIFAVMDQFPEKLRNFVLLKDASEVVPF
jgi:ankyrin repeat protein